MRIAFVAHDDLRPSSGGNIYDRQLVDGLRALGDSVQVIDAPAPGQAVSWAERLIGHDCLIEDQLLHSSLLPAHSTLRAARLPVVALVHNLTSTQPSQAGRPQLRQHEQAYFRSVDALVTVCQQTLDDARACGGQGLPALVAYPGRGDEPAGDPAGVRARAAEPGPLRVLFVGVVAPHKGLPRLLQALSRLPPGAATLDVAGWLDRDRAHVDQVRALIAQLGLSARVRLHGGLDRSSLRALYRSSQVLALPSDREAYPLVGLEALGQGLPLLMTDRGGTAELLQGPGAGVLLDPDDPAAWADQLGRWQADRAALAAASVAALGRFQAHRSWTGAAGVAAQVREFLGAVTAPASPAGPPAPA